MAYIPATEEEKIQEDDQGMNVLGGQTGAPTQQPQDAQAPQPASGSTFIGQDTAQPQQQQSGQPKGSGLFTNLRKYVKANTGAGQQMGQAVTKQVGEQASQIGQAVQSQKNKLQQRLQEGQSKIAGAQQFGQQTLQQAGSQPFQDQDVTKFQQLSSGQKRFDQVGPANYTQQQLQAQKLNQQAQAAETERGSQELLRQTFGQDQRYTRGQQQLDNLIFGADPNARRQAIEGIRGAAGQTQEQIEQAQLEGRTGIADIRQAQRGLQEGLQTGLQDAFTGVRSGLESRAGDYDAQMRELAQNIAQGLREGQVYEEDLGSLTGEGSEYLRGLVGEYTGLGEGADVDDIIGQVQARGVLGQEIEGQQVYNDPDLQRLATEQEYARQRALEQLGNISEAERTFLTGPEELLGQLQVGQYTGQDLGLTGDEGQRTFQSAYNERMKQIGGEIDQAVKKADDVYYEDYGVRTGYGYTPTRGSRDAGAIARDVIDSGGQLDLSDPRLAALYNLREGSTLAPENYQEKFSNILETNPEIEEILNTLPVESLNDGYGGFGIDSRLNRIWNEVDSGTRRDLKEYGKIKQAERTSQRYQQEIEARKQAIEAMRRGRFGLASRTGGTTQTPTNRVVLSPEEQNQVRGIIS